MGKEATHPVRLDLLAQPGRVWLYVLAGAILGAVFEIVVGLPLNIIFRSFFEYMSVGNPLRLEYLLTHPLRPGEWPALSLSGLLFGAALGFAYYRLRENQKRLAGLKQEFEIQVAALRHHYKNLAIGISGFSDRAGRKLEKVQEQIAGLPDFVDHTELEALRRSLLNLLAASQSLSTSLVDELVFLKALQSCELPPEPHDFFPVVRQAIHDLLEMRFHDKPITVQLNGKPLDEPTAPLVFPFEPHSLEIILQNLLSNAMRFGDVIQVSATGHRHGVRIEINDNGPGLELTEIKAALLRADKRLAAESTQLGLRVTLYLLDKCGGQLYAVSPPGRGATFILEFPRRGF
jgi:signal transduction histidine kinase